MTKGLLRGLGSTHEWRSPCELHSKLRPSVHSEKAINFNCSRYTVIIVGKFEKVLYESNLHEMMVTCFLDSSFMRLALPMKILPKKL